MNYLKDPKLLNSKWIAMLLICLTPTLFINAKLKTQRSLASQKKAELTEEIYNNIARTVKDSRKQPTFNFIYNKKEPYYNAFYNPANHTINVGEGIYDLAATFGEDATDVLASVIGHELAHFYKDHGWGMAFGMANEDTEIADKIYELKLTSERRAEMEAEADYFGGLFGYLAGYNTLDVSGDFFDLLYETVGIPNETFGYPSRKDRINIANNSRDMLKELIPVFEAGNLLALTGDYEKAMFCYEHVITTFPSRELYNNAGVNIGLKALSLYEPEDLRFVYPLGLDLETRLNNAGTKGVGETKAAKIQRLLKEAKQQFDDAIRIDENYAPAYINLSLVQGLMGENELALANAGKAIKMAKSQKNIVLESNGYIARGVVYAKLNQKGKAKEAFELGKKGNPVVAETNLDALQTGLFSKLFKKRPTGEKIEDVEETIADISPAIVDILMEDGEVKPKVIRSQNKERPKTAVYKMQEEGFEATAVAVYDDSWDVNGISSFIKTEADYDGETGREISIGASLKDVKTAYGTPTKTFAGVQSSFLLYERAKIIFIVDKEKEVTGWILYGNI